jgi:iron(III) transport system substrate-binding protein
VWLHRSGGTQPRRPKVAGNAPDAPLQGGQRRPAASAAHEPDRRRRAAKIAAIVGSGALVFAGCSATIATPPPATAAPAAPTSAVAAASQAAGGASAAPAQSVAAAAPPTQAPVPLVVYSAQGYDSAMTKAFQAATGIPVQLVDDSTGPLLVKVQAEKNNPKWDVLWVDGDEAFASLDQQNYLVKGYEPGVSFNSLGMSLIPADKSYVPTGVTMAGTVVYSSKTVSSPPASWNALLSPSWKGLVGMNDPAVSGPTYPFVAGLFNYLGGVSQGETFLQKLKANGLQINQTNGDTLHALEGGQIRIALIQSSAGIGAEAKDPSLKTAFINPATPIPSVIGIDAKASPQAIAEAEQFAAFVLSAQGQSVMQSGDPSGDSLYWPIVNGVQPLPELPPLSSVPAKPIDPALWGSRENAINTWFTSNIVQ